MQLLLFLFLKICVLLIIIFCIFSLKIVFMQYFSFFLIKRIKKFVFLKLSPYICTAKMQWRDSSAG